MTGGVLLTPLMMATTPQFLMYRLGENHHVYAGDDYNHSRAQHWRKWRRELVVVLAEVLHRREEERT